MQHGTWRVTPDWTGLTAVTLQPHYHRPAMHTGAPENSRLMHTWSE